MSEQSYTHKSLREIRRTVALRLGFDPEGDSNDMISKQLDEFIRAASLEANEKCAWAYSQTTYDITTGEQQGEIQYPPGCGPGSILQVSIWLDDDRRASYPTLRGLKPPNTYLPLMRVRMANDLDADPLLELGGDDADKVLGIPLYWDVRKAIRIRPYTDQAYQMRVLFTETPELRCDTDRTVMDAELIMLLTLSQYQEYAGDYASGQTYRARAEQRIVRLRAQQSTGQRMNLMRGVDLSLSPDEEAMISHDGDCPTFDFRARGQTWDAAGNYTSGND